MRSSVDHLVDGADLYRYLLEVLDVGHVDFPLFETDVRGQKFRVDDGIFLRFGAEGITAVAHLGERLTLLGGERDAEWLKKGFDFFHVLLHLVENVLRNGLPMRLFSILNLPTFLESARAGLANRRRVSPKHRP
jgi:hypothetical protein